MAEQLELETDAPAAPPDDSLRGAISAAIDASEKPEAPEKVEAVQPSNPPIGGETEQQKTERVRNEKGQFAKKEEGEVVKTQDEVKPPPEAVKSAVPPTPTFSTDGAKPPSSWRPAAREHFAKLPPEVQEEAIRIDREVRKTMQDSAEARQNYQRFRETFEPYMPMLRAQNQDPFQFSAQMAQTVAALATGPQQTKAEIVANVIKAYGIDIPTLAAVLDGTPVPQQQQQVYRDPRVDELLQTVEQAKAQRDQQLAAQAQESIKGIEQEEFFWDVKDDIADLLDLAANRNLALTPKEAYNRAIMMHPEITKVVQQRQAAQAAVNPNGSTQRSRAAASSPRASPTAPSPQGSQDRTLRDEVSAAWDAAMNSR